MDEREYKDLIIESLRLVKEFSLVIIERNPSLKDRVNPLALIQTVVHDLRVEFEQQFENKEKSQAKEP